jgi:Holliday junction resolvase RusA-like endonuclease
LKSVVAAVCNERIGRVPNFGSDVNLKLTVQFRFPSPKTEKGAIGKKADLDNLCKLLLDSLNGVLYFDDGQFVNLIADKAFDDSFGGSGFTVFAIEVVDF